MTFIPTATLVILALVSYISGELTASCEYCLCVVAGNCRGGNNYCADNNNKCQITPGYYADAGQPAGPGGHESCVKNQRCASATIKGYMARYEQDCNGDGVIDCQDYFAIHTVGPYGCDHTPPLLPLLNQCLAQAGPSFWDHQPRVDHRYPPYYDDREPYRYWTPYVAYAAGPDQGDGLVQDRNPRQDIDDESKPDESPEEADSLSLGTVHVHYRDEQNIDDSYVQNRYPDHYSRNTPVRTRYNDRIAGVNVGPFGIGI